MYLIGFTRFLVGTGLLLATASAAAELERTAAGHPDLTGTYDSGTLTPEERPEVFGDKQFMSREEADLLLKTHPFTQSDANEISDPNRGAPQAGGDGQQAYGAGGVGGYNSFWVEPGSGVSEVNGKIRTSIIYDPPNGRRPPMTPAGMRRIADEFSSFSHQNDGTASWLDSDEPGPFDGPEDVALAERCLLGFSAGPPSMPGLYNNFKRIVQTDDHVMILVEMVHDARIIRLNSEHGPDTNRKWLGDSIGRWEGDTLVVETKNFKEKTGLYGGDENLHLTERFTKLDNGNLLYNFTVDDPTAWTKPWSGEYVWKSSTDKVYEYACHEGNYAMGNILRGARLLEREARAAQAKN
ncbi:MAG: hypothetical protein VXX02_04885 [Pseudomonadota bacterium]|nr:hypothetical protein [Pseudomonadota bacterium]MEC7250746.1 hypothetical protein [Pseudomonadota bacterium]MEC7612618.1 hypothetical protein [Pseudomonadota bacterium]MEC7956425.1 hypothetical protein [Pseudomonadota bacterium]MEC8046652.1 hypothetical protein [Pseudomonadota bacterium]